MRVLEEVLVGVDLGVVGFEFEFDLGGVAFAGAAATTGAGAGAGGVAIVVELLFFGVCDPFPFFAASL